MVRFRGRLELLIALSVAAAAMPAIAHADVYLPLLLRDELREGIAPVPTAEVTRALPTPTGVVSTASPTTDEPGGTPTQTAMATPTATIQEPLETPTPTLAPTRPPAQGRIHGRCTVRGKPLFEGYGAPPYPQIQLRRGVGGIWERVAHATTDGEGRFEFLNPPPLESGEVYQVWWVNEDSEESAGDWTLLGRWWSRLIPQFGDGSDIDVGVFELADLEYQSPCNDCHQTPPITYMWRPRANSTDVYRWSLHQRCGDVADKLNRSFRTESLGHGNSYTTGPPPGFQFDRRYCWYIYIEDGQNGTGWPYFEWVTAYLSGASAGWLPGWLSRLARLWPVSDRSPVDIYGVGQGSATAPKGSTSRTP